MTEKNLFMQNKLLPRGVPGHYAEYVRAIGGHCHFAYAVYCEQCRLGARRTVGDLYKCLGGRYLERLEILLLCHVAAPQHQRFEQLRIPDLFGHFFFFAGRAGRVCHPGNHVVYAQYDPALDFKKCLVAEWFVLHGPQYVQLYGQGLCQCGAVVAQAFLCLGIVDVHGQTDDAVSHLLNLVREVSGGGFQTLCEQRQ